MGLLTRPRPPPGRRSLAPYQGFRTFTRWSDRPILERSNRQNRQISVPKIACGIVRHASGSFSTGVPVASRLGDWRSPACRDTRRTDLEGEVSDRPHLSAAQGAADLPWWLCWCCRVMTHVTLHRGCHPVPRIVRWTGNSNASQHFPQVGLWLTTDGQMGVVHPPQAPRWASIVYPHSPMVRRDNWGVLRFGADLTARRRKNAETISRALPARRMTH